MYVYHIHLYVKYKKMLQEVRCRDMNKVANITKTLETQNWRRPINQTSSPKKAQGTIKKSLKNSLNKPKCLKSSHPKPSIKTPGSPNPRKISKIRNI
jgi:phage FluMu protein Com